MAVRLLPFQFPGLSAVRCAFQLRASAGGPLDGGSISFTAGPGREEVEASRRDFLAQCGLDDWCEINQVHGDRMIFEPGRVAPDAQPSPEANADGMATSQKGRALLVKTADCQPLLVAHRSGRFVAALHVGWRGSRMLFPFTGVRAFCGHYGIKPADCLAVRGPSLGPAKAEFIHFAKEWGWYFRSYYDARTQTVDLWNMTRDQLVQAGIPRGAIYGIDLCTGTNSSLLFSYRADHGCGRQGSLIWIAE